jgi:hypothetical protein
MVRSKPIMLEFTRAFFKPFRKPQHIISQLEGFGTIVALKP